MFLWSESSITKQHCLLNSSCKLVIWSLEVGKENQHLSQIELHLEEHFNSIVKPKPCLCKMLYVCHVQYSFMYSFQVLFHCFEGNTTEEQQPDMMTCNFFAFVFVFHAVLFYDTPPHLGGDIFYLFNAIRIYLVKPSIFRFGHSYFLCDSLKCKMAFFIMRNSWIGWN